QGCRFTVTCPLGTNSLVGVEAGYFFLADKRADVRFASNGDPLLAQPFINAATGRPDATLVALPGVAVGAVGIAARTGPSGAEATLTGRLIESERFHLTALGGFRFLRLEDQVTSSEGFQVAPPVPGFGGNRVGVRDDFRTVNRFYGGQAGLEAGIQ